MYPLVRHFHYRRLHSRAPITTTSHTNLKRFFPKGLPFSILEHLEWMSKKRALKQDFLLLSPPPTQFTRLIALEFAHLNNLQVEIVSLSPDTTEADLKTRRDLVNSSVKFSDQAPVRAALQGKMLILDGLEKCERNILPTLNNLLENREINLDDGRLIVSHSRFQTLLKNTAEASLRSSGIVSAHPDFFVVSLTSPIPPYRGRPLDPPLRSRFQVRRVDFPHPLELIEAGYDESLVRIAAAINTACQQDPKMFFRFPDLNLFKLNERIRKNTELDIATAFSHYYPWIHQDLKLSQTKALNKLFAGSSLRKSSGDGNKISTVDVSSIKNFPKSRFRILLALHEDNSLDNDILLCGPPGCGKSCKIQQLLHG
jgi:hypothetical protein